MHTVNDAISRVPPHPPRPHTPRAANSVIFKKITAIPLPPKIPSVLRALASIARHGVLYGSRHAFGNKRKRKRYRFLAKITKKKCEEKARGFSFHNYYKAETPSFISPFFIKPRVLSKRPRGDACEMPRATRHDSDTEKPRREKPPTRQHQKGSYPNNQ